jgi:hypothetical protein
VKIQKKSFEGMLDSFEAREVFEWPETSQCQIITDSITRQRSILIEPSKLYAVRPLEEPSFFLSFARLGSRGEPSESKIRDWVLRYGLPMRVSGDTRSDESAATYMPVTQFREEVKRAYGLLTLYADIKGRNLSAVRSRIADPKSPLDDGLVATRQSSDYRYLLDWVEVGALEEDGPELFLAFRALSDTLADLMTGVRVRLDVVMPSRALQAYRCTDLLSALYLQFYLLVIEQKPMHYCEHPTCGLPFPAKPKHRRFCSRTCKNGAKHHRDKASS